MAGFIRRRALAVLAAVVLVGAVLGAVVVASMASQHPTARLARVPIAPLQPIRTPTITTSSPHGLGPVSLQLAAQNVTPDSSLRVMASGFLSGEPLAVAIEDRQGQSYKQVTLQADKEGSLHETSLTLPEQLGAGAYRLTVVGRTSHRRASATFQMNDIPPTVTLDAYYATPGQAVGFAGNGFIPGEAVMVYLGSSPAPLFRTTVKAGGAVSGLLEIPKIPAGTYTLKLVGETGRMPVSVGFDVQQFTPWVVLDHYALVPGERVGFSGHGFAPGEQVFVYLNSPHGTPVLRVRADTAGELVMQDTWWPGGASGTNVLTFVGQWSKATTTVDFTVQAIGQSSAQPTVSHTAP